MSTLGMSQGSPNLRAKQQTMKSQVSTYACSLLISFKQGLTSPTSSVQARAADGKSQLTLRTQAHKPLETNGSLRVAHETHLLSNEPLVYNNRSDTKPALGSTQILGPMYVDSNTLRKYKDRNHRMRRHIHKDEAHHEAREAQPEVKREAEVSEQEGRFEEENEIEDLGSDYGEDTDVALFQTLEYIYQNNVSIFLRSY